MIKPQKALHLYKELEKKRTTVQDDEFFIFEKYDGWWGCKRVSESPHFTQLILSRAGRFIPSLLDLSRSMAAFEVNKSIPPTSTIIFEILVEGVPVFKDLNGLLNRSKDPCQCKDAYVIVHDLLPKDISTPFATRYKLARDYVERLGHPRVRLAPMIGTGNYAQVQAEAERIWARRSKDISDEGAIGKRWDAPYSEGKRNKDLIKVKSEVTLEMEVIGVERGQGKYSYTAGKLTVRQANGTIHSVSGMTDAERDLWWDNQHLIIGKVVEIQAMQVLANGSLREGRMKAVRHDKNVSEID